MPNDVIDDKIKLRKQIEEEMQRVAEVSDEELRSKWIQSEVLTSDPEVFEHFLYLLKGDKDKVFCEIVRRKPDYFYKLIELRDHFKRWEGLEEAQKRTAGARKIAWAGLIISIVSLILGTVLKPFIDYIWKLILF